MFRRHGGNGDYSSIGRAPGCDPGCRGFEPRQPPLTVRFYASPFSFARFTTGTQRFDVRPLWYAYRMDPNTVAAIIAAIGAIASAMAAFTALVPARKAAKAAEEQTNLQLDIIRKAAQPYVWASMQPDQDSGTLFHLIIGNSGPTIARNIRVTIDPPLPDLDSSSHTMSQLQQDLREGIISLAPGDTLHWHLRPASNHIASNTTHKITATADGPYGPLEPAEFIIRPQTLQTALAYPQGSLHSIRQELKNIDKSIIELKDFFIFKEIRPTPNHKG